MYESPIKLKEIGTHISERITKATDEYIFAQVNMVVDVDKEELIKALSYDRNQYQKGYADGYADAKVERKTGKWIPCSERLPNDADYKECSAFSGGAVWYFTDKGEMGLGYCYTSIKEWETIDEWSPYGKVIAWMPLPEPYKENEYEEKTIKPINTE